MARARRGGRGQVGAAEEAAVSDTIDIPITMLGARPEAQVLLDRVRRDVLRRLIEAEWEARRAAQEPLP